MVVFYEPPRRNPLCVKSVFLGVLNNKKIFFGLYILVEKNIEMKHQNWGTILQSSIANSKLASIVLVIDIGSLELGFSII